MKAVSVGLWLLVTAYVTGQNLIDVGPFQSEVSAGLFGEVYQTATLIVGTGAGSSNPAAHVKWKLESIKMLSGGPNLLVVWPTSGTTPSTVYVGPDPKAVATSVGGSGRVSASLTFVTVDESPGNMRPPVVTINVREPSAPAIQSVTNAGSGSGGASPAGLVSIRGENLAPPVGEISYDSTGAFPSYYGREFQPIQVTMNGAQAPLVYLSPKLINVIAPASLAGQKTAEVVVTRYAAISQAFSVPVADLAPALFTATPPGATQGAPLSYRFPNYTPVTEETPAALGEMVVLFATGAGPWPDLPENTISLTARNYTQKPISLTIGGLPARLYYAGVAPYQPAMLQINAYVPQGLSPGVQPIVLKIGDQDNAAQRYTLPFR